MKEAQFDDTEGVSSVIDKSLSIDWEHFKNEDLIRLLADNVIYDADDIIAFDKPAGLPYSGSKATRVQIDRVLQDVKKLVAPDCKRLHLIESLDKSASGIIYFAKTPERCEQLKQWIDEGKVSHRFRVIVKGIPEAETADINIPLHKMMKDGDIRWVPVQSHTSNKICYNTTRYRTVNVNRQSNASMMDIFVNKSSDLHQIRSHLALGINCPLIGETKYNPKAKNVPVNLGARILDSFGMGANRSRNVPIFAHLSEVLIPVGAGKGSRFSIVKSNYPPLFVNVVKALSLLRK